MSERKKLHKSLTKLTQATIKKITRKQRTKTTNTKPKPKPKKKPTPKKPTPPRTKPRKKKPTLPRKTRQKLTQEQKNTRSVISSVKKQEQIKARATREANMQYRKDLKAEIKRMNTRLATLYKHGFKNTDAYKHIEKQKYFRRNITGKSQSGAMKIRTDLTKLSKKQLNDIEKLLNELSNMSTTLTDVREEHEKGYRRLIQAPDDYEVSEQELYEYIGEKKKAQEEAENKLFYLAGEGSEPGGTSDLYDAVYEHGYMTHDEAIEYATNEIIRWKREQEQNNLDSDISDEIYKQLFYTGNIDHYK